MSYDLVVNLLLIVIGIFVLIRSGIYIVKSLVAIAHFLNVSEFTLSFILMAFATTLPEFAIGVNAAVNNQPLISLGNILGANILNLSLTLGLITLIAGKLTIKSYSLAHRSWFNFALGISPILFAIDGEISKIDGLALIILFFLHISRLFHLREIFHHKKNFWLSLVNNFGHRPDGLGIKYFFKNLFIFIAGAGLLLLSANLAVKGAKAISLDLGVSEIIIGIFIVALGTTLPEIVFGIRAAISKNKELSLGNLFGATVFNSTWILGVVSLISPIKIQMSLSFWISAATMILVLFLANLFLSTRGEITKREGIGLILIYILFVAFQIFTINRF